VGEHDELHAHIIHRRLQRGGKACEQLVSRLSQGSMHPGWRIPPGGMKSSIASERGVVVEQCAVVEAHTVRLLDLPDEALELIDAGHLSEGHGKALLSEPDHYRRRALARRAAEGQLVRQPAW
jgi:HTH domain found in ParB protein